MNRTRLAGGLPVCKIGPWTEGLATGGYFLGFQARFVDGTPPVADVWSEAETVVALAGIAGVVGCGLLALLVARRLEGPFTRLCLYLLAASFLVGDLGYGLYGAMEPELLRDWADLSVVVATRR